MKIVSALIALTALFFCDAALAASAVATSITGSSQVQTGTASLRPLRLGDEVRQGDIVSTGANSSVVLKFDDGQVAALSSNSRMQITSYAYEPSSSTGNVLLSLLTGGMRTITGLIGKKSPSQVSYRAATATIGIRGTDTTIVTDGGNVFMTVTEGVVTFTMGGKTLELKAGESVFARADGTTSRGTAAQMLALAPAAFQAAYAQFLQMAAAIAEAGPGVPRVTADEIRDARTPLGQQGVTTTQGAGGSSSPQ